MPKDTAAPPAPQSLGLLEACLPVAALVGLLGLSFGLFGADAAAGPNQIALVLSTLVAVVVVVLMVAMRIAWRISGTRQVDLV